MGSYKEAQRWYRRSVRHCKKVVDILPVSMISQVQGDSTKSSLKIPARFELLLLLSGEHIVIKSFDWTHFCGSEVINEDDVAQRYLPLRDQGQGWMAGWLNG
jgi:hypothetical protein